MCVLLYRLPPPPRVPTGMSGFRPGIPPVASDLKKLGQSRPRQARSPVRRPLPGLASSSVPLNMTREEMQEARRQFEENQKRASEASARRHKADEEARRKKAEEERKRSESARAYQQERKRAISAVSPATTTHHAPSKRPRATVGRCRLVWDEEHDRDSFVDIALREGDKQPIRQAIELAADAARDGMVLVEKDGQFCTYGLDQCMWFKSKPWRDIASSISVKEDSNGKVVITSDSCLNAKCLGSGTFNYVAEVDKCRLPPWLPVDSALRITRPDRPESTEHKYQTISKVADEAHTAMYASANGFGVKVYAIAAFEGIRWGRSMRYGTVYALEKAKCDMNKTLRRITTSSDAISLAKNVTEMLYDASRCGIAFVDIKPGNILEMNDGTFRLTDYDPSFFLTVPGKDWRALLLINLAFLSCHVRNGTSGDVSQGWATAVKPLLKQLIDRRGSYEGDWVFTARSVRMEFDTPVDHSDFELQRMMSVMATSYLYGKDVKDVDSARWHWQVRDQTALDSHRRVALNRKSWPVVWGPDYVPLITQMVNFATERAVP